MKSLVWAGAAALTAIAPNAGAAAHAPDADQTDHAASAQQASAADEADAEPLIDASLDLPDNLDPLLDPNVPLGGSALA